MNGLIVDPASPTQHVQTFFRGPMMEKAKPGFRLYWIEFTVLLAGVILAVLFAKFTGQLSKAGGITVFAAVIAQSFASAKANVKHIKNAQRVSNGEQPLDFSNIGTTFSILAAVIVAIGTFFWALF